MLNPKIVVEHSPIAGSGLLATSTIEKGEMIWSTDRPEAGFSLEDIHSWQTETQEFFWALAYRIGPNHFSGPRTRDSVDPSDYMNHSCEPSAWFCGYHRMESTRTIGAGEEITFDYATSGIRPGYFLKCLCGTSSCRGSITEDDLRNSPELQQRYLGHILDHMLLLPVAPG